MDHGVHGGARHEKTCLPHVSVDAAQRLHHRSRPVKRPGRDAKRLAQIPLGHDASARKDDVADEETRAFAHADGDDGRAAADLRWGNVHFGREEALVAIHGLDRPRERGRVEPRGQRADGPASRRPSRDSGRLSLPLNSSRFAPQARGRPSASRTLTPSPVTDGRSPRIVGAR